MNANAPVSAEVQGRATRKMFSRSWRTNIEAGVITVLATARWAPRAWWAAGLLNLPEDTAIETLTKLLVARHFRMTNEMLNQIITITETREAVTGVDLQMTNFAFLDDGANGVVVGEIRRTRRGWVLENTYPLEHTDHVSDGFRLLVPNLQVSELEHIVLPL